ncbi:MAG: DUF6092 family protein [Candidatus Bathyarchaeota archaeon]|nr:DUF6092 family protein [Candidatus Bathyarchaeota archaeon]
MAVKKLTGNDYLFEIAVFLATSARGCIDEPPLYGPFRLLDALSKLTDLPEYAIGLNPDPFLKEIKAIVDEKKFLVMYDVDGFQRAIDEIVEKFAKELKKRYLETK